MTSKNGQPVIASVESRTISIEHDMNKMAGLDDSDNMTVSQNVSIEENLLPLAHGRTHSTGTEAKAATGCEDTAFHGANWTHKAAREEDNLSDESITSSQSFGDNVLKSHSPKNTCSSSLIENLQGYKAVILFASFFFYMVNCGIGLSVGVYIVALQEDFEVGSSLTALTPSLFMGIRYMTAPISSLLVDRFGFRVIVMTGGFIATIGCLAAAFANSIYVVMVSFGIIAAFGSGLAYVPALTIPAAYYDERGRAFALPFASVGCGVGHFVMTNVLAATIEAYGWRGSMFISAGVIMQVVVLGALMRTPEMWRNPHPNQTDAKSFNCNQIFRIYKNVDLVMFFLHHALMGCGLSVIYGHITALTETLPNVSKQQAALPLSIIGLSTIFGRASMGVIGQLKCVDLFLFYWIGSLASGVVIMLVPVVSNYTFTVICTFVFGLMLAPYGSLCSIMILYFCDLSDLNAAFAQTTLLSGLGYVSGAPLGGWLYEVTGNYGSSIYLGGALTIFSSLLLIWPYMNYRRRQAEDVTIIGDQVKGLSVGSMAQ